MCEDSRNEKVSRLSAKWTVKGGKSMESADLMIWELAEWQLKCLVSNGELSRADFRPDGSEK